MKPILKRDIPLRTTASILALVLLATVVVAREKPEPVQTQTESTSAVEVRAAVAADQPAADLDIEKLNRPEQQAPVNDLFAMRDPAPRKKILRRSSTAAQPESAEPAVPPLPFTYVGQVRDGGVQEVFLALGGDYYSVAEGETIDDMMYRVDQIAEHEILFTYLPSGTRQTLPIPVSN